MNKIHAVDFKLDGSGVVNILDTDVTRDPAKLELRQESMQQTEEGAIIIRRFDLTDEEKHRQMEREIFEEPKSAEEKLRAGDPAASLEIVSKAKSKAAPKTEAASSSSGIAQVIGDAVGQFIKPKTKDQGTMASYKRAPQLPKISTATGTSPMASPKPSPPPTPKSAIGSPKPEPPALPAEAADQPMPKALPFKAPPPTLTTTSPRAPPQKSSAPTALPSMEPAPKIAKKEPPMASAPPPGTGGPQPPAEPPLRPSGYPKWYFFSPGTGERREFTMRCTELPGLRDLGHLSYDDFKFSKRVTGLLRGYDHKFLEPHHRHIPPEFDDELYLNFESMYSYLRKRYRAQLSKQDLYLILRTGQVHVSH